MTQTTTITINENTPVAALTLGQLFAALRDEFGPVMAQPSPAAAENPQTEHYDSKDYAYGLNGICELFGVSKNTASKYKNTWLAPAVMQRGNQIIVNRKMALELFNARNKEDNQ